MNTVPVDVKAVSVEVQDVSKIFQDKVAVDHVSFEVKPGEFVSLLGPSGCGKSTVLRLIAGFEEPDQGKIFVNGQDQTKTPTWRRNTVMVFQNYALFPHMNVKNNIAYGLKMREISEDEIEKRVQSIMEKVGLSKFALRFPSTLSGGQQQRVALARSLVVEPPILLFDEPLSNLDVLLKEEMIVYIKRIVHDSKITAIYVTHDRSEAMALSDRIIVMKDGKIMQMGEPEQVYANPNSQFVARFFGEVSFLPVNVIHIEANHAIVQLKDMQMQIDTANIANVSMGKYILACRPEALEIVDSGKGYVDGIVGVDIFLGSYREYYISTEYGDIAVKSAPFGKIFQPNTPVAIQIVQNQARILAID